MRNYVFHIRKKLANGDTEFYRATAAKAKTYEGALKQIQTRFPPDKFEYIYKWIDETQTARYFRE